MTDRGIRMFHVVSMRIAIITESFAPDLNGVANCVLRVAEHLVQRGHEPLIIAPEPAGSRSAGPFPYPVERVPSMSLPGYPGFRLGLPTRAVRSALARHRADLVHLASPVFLGATGSTAARHLRPADDRGVPDRHPRLRPRVRLARSRARRPPGAGCAASTTRRTGPWRRPPAILTQLRAHGFERIWLWGRGVDLNAFRSRRSAVPRCAGSWPPDGEVLAGYVGRLATEKRVDLLAPVAELPGVRLIVVGGGPAAAALRERMPSAVFLGEQRGEELARTYASLDLFVHSGPHETFGQTLQEAAASGVPVVAPAAGGPLDLVEDGVTGFLVPPGSGPALAAAVARLAADPGLRAEQGRAARQKVLTRDWTAVGDALIGHYEAVLQPRAGRRAARGGVTTFAALGDSITVGIGDPAAGARARLARLGGLLAEGLPEPRLHNLATSGAQAADVERDQLPPRLALRPTWPA